MFNALILIVLVIYNNPPSLKGFRESHSLKKFFEKFKKHNPAKIKDDEAKWDRVPTKIDMDEILSVDLQPSNNYTPDKAEKEDK